MALHSFKHYDPYRQCSGTTIGLNIPELEEVAEKIYEQGTDWINAFRECGIELGYTSCSECGTYSGIGATNVRTPSCTGNGRCTVRGLRPKVLEFSDAMGDPLINKNSFDIIAIGKIISHYTLNNCNCSIKCIVYINKKSLPSHDLLMKVVNNELQSTKKCSCGLIWKLYPESSLHRDDCDQN